LPGAGRACNLPPPVHPFDTAERGVGPSRAASSITLALLMPMRESAPVLLPHPWLAIAPLYPGGFFPPFGPGGGEMLAQAAAARLATDWRAARCAAEHAAAQAMEAGSGDADALLELAGVAILSGHVDESEALYRRMVDGDGGRTPPHRALVGVAVAAGVRGEYAAALQAIDAADAAGGTREDADAVVLLANRSAALLGLGRLWEAERAGADALRAGRRMKSEHQAAVGGFAAGLAHLARGRANEARTRLADCARAFTRAGDVLRQVQCHHLLGEISYDGEDPIRAGSHYRDALAVARPAGATGTVELLTLRFEHR
jgi:tetratricopeptide (TPR) repeat protein